MEWPSLSRFSFACLLGTAFLFGQSQVASAAAIATPIAVAQSAEYDRKSDEFASAVVLDVKTGKTLYSYQPDKKWTAASLTKLMSMQVFLDRKVDWGKVVALSSKDEVGGGRLRVSSGAKMSIRDLFYSSVVGSANNTTMALARLSGLGMGNFVKQMNAKAKKLGLTTTSFVEPTGMDPANVTTAAEMAKLAQAAFQNASIRQAAGTMSYRFPIRNQSVIKTITNTNRLLVQDDDMYVYAGKTGYLEESMYNLVVDTQTNPRETTKPRLLVVVLGSPSKERSFNSAKALAKWAWNAYSWRSTAPETVAVKTP